MQKLSKLKVIRGSAAIYVVLNHSVRSEVMIGYSLIRLAFSYLVERVIYVKLNNAIMNRYYYNKAKTVSV